jgi:hypothetical protein
MAGVAVVPVRVADLDVPGRTFVGTAPHVATMARRSERRLADREIRRRLGPPPVIDGDVLLDAIFDESGSMTSGNDAFRHRREAVLIAAEHLASRSRRGARWSARLTSFDCAGPLDLPLTTLDRVGLRVVRERLLTGTPGGCSRLGPALLAVESAPQRDGRRVLVVLSDFELFDPDPRQVVRRLVRATADVVVAVVFRAPVPDEFADTRVRVLHVVDGTRPDEISAAVVDAARVIAART